MGDLAKKEGGLEWLEVMLRYLTQATDKISEEDLEKAIEAVLPGEGGKLMGTIAEKWMERGLEQGLERGLEQGLEQGIRQGVLSGIEIGIKLRFGEAGLGLMPEIQQIKDVTVLQTIQEGLLTASTPEELRKIYLPYLAGNGKKS